MKISLITTVFNEQYSIDSFIKSILLQTKKPDEIIIVDGGSSDGTVAKVQSSKCKMQNYSLKFKIIQKKGNRSVGRNKAIRNSTGDIIVCSDAGNILHKDWIKNITKPFKDKTVDVVAGYYKGRAMSIFEKCLLPYVLVMPDRVNPKNFLPATRSMAFRKKLWEKVEGFNEKFSHNEDFVFAKSLNKGGAKVVFQKDAIVYWIPRKSLKEAFKMFFRFAIGDSEAGLRRIKVMLIFIRYVIGIMLLIYYLVTKSAGFLNIILALILVYIFWSVWKNYQYIKKWKAIIYLPILQITSDVAVILGTTIGTIKLLRMSSKNYQVNLFFNFYLLLIIILLIISTVANIAKIIHFVFLFAFFMPFIFFVLKLSSEKILAELFALLLIYALSIFATFRYIRSLFYPPEILEEKIVGYAQYFGYPFYFDTLLFFIFVLTPIAPLFYILFKKKNQ